MKNKIYAMLLLLLVLSPVAYAADGVGEFIGNLIPDAITKSLEGMRIFFYDFMAFVLDIFTILLFILWILLIVGILYSLFWLFSLPKKIGAENFNDAMVVLSKKMWDFVK